VLGVTANDAGGVTVAGNDTGNVVPLGGAAEGHRGALSEAHGLATTPQTGVSRDR